MAESEWIDCGTNHYGQGIWSKIIFHGEYNSEQKRAEAMRQKQVELNYSTWGVRDGERDGKKIYVFEVHETKLVDVELGTYEDFPWIDLLYGLKEKEYVEDTIEDTIFSIENDYTIDTFIEDLLINFNEAGLQTWVSCSGLVEDHLGVVPYDEISTPYIGFNNFDDIKDVLRIIANTGWVMEVSGNLHAKTGKL